jgi:hypothetical protein
MSADHNRSVQFRSDSSTCHRRLKLDERGEDADADRDQGAEPDGDAHAHCGDFVRQVPTNGRDLVADVLDLVSDIGNVGLGRGVGRNGVAGRLGDGLGLRLGHPGLFQPSCVGKRVERHGAYKLGNSGASVQP